MKTRIKMIQDILTDLYASQKKATTEQSKEKAQEAIEHWIAELEKLLKEKEQALPICSVNAYGDCPYCTEGGHCDNEKICEKS